MTEQERLEKRKAFRQKWAVASERAVARDRILHETLRPAQPAPYNEVVDAELADVFERILSAYPECQQVDIVLQSARLNGSGEEGVTRAIRLWKDGPNGEEELIDAPEFQGDIDG